MGRVTNKIVAITGGTSGIGIAAARQFISDDASYIRGVSEYDVISSNCILFAPGRHQGKRSIKADTVTAGGPELIRRRYHTPPQ